MKAINIVKIQYGIIKSIETFLIITDDEVHNPIVQEAKDRYAQIIREQLTGLFKEEEMDEQVEAYLENENFVSYDGSISYSLVWSEVKN